MIRRHISYANVTATLALVLALGGGAYAVQGIPDRTGVFHGCVNKRNGALRLMLRPGSASYGFVTSGGQTLDSGSVRCQH